MELELRVTGEHFGIVERTAGLGCAIALLRAQMSAGQDRAGFVHLEPIAGVERFGDARRDSKVRRELLRQRALGGLDQPAGIANEHRTARIAVQSIEQALHLAKIALGVVDARVPDSQTEMLEKTEHEGAIHDVSERDTSVPSWPSRGIPVVVGARHEIDRIEPMRVSVPRDGLEAVVHVRGSQRVESTGQVGKLDRCVEGAGEQPLQASPVAAARRLLVLHVEDLPLDGFDDDGPAIETRPSRATWSVKEGGMPLQDFTFRRARAGLTPRV